MTCLCCKCFKNGRTQKHHILPVRFFGKNDKIVYICEECHKEIERILPLFRKLKAEEYYKVHRVWLAGGTPVIQDNKYKNEHRNYRRFPIMQTA